MYPASFAYTRAESLEHALEVLREDGDECAVLAGGASLIPLMKLRLASPARVLDIGRLGEVSGVQCEDGSISFGALTTHAAIEADDGVCRLLPILRDVASHIGDTQVRNMGTIGGAVAEADPAGDWAPALLALGGEIRAVAVSGEKAIPVDDLFLDAFTTALEPEDLLTEIVVPIPGARSGAAHAKFEVRAGDYALASCSVAVSVDESGGLEKIRIALGAVGLRPTRVAAAEDLLRGQVPTLDLVREASAVVVESTEESYSDARGSAAHRRRLAGAMFERAIDVALQRAVGQEGGSHG